MQKIKNKNDLLYCWNGKVVKLLQLYPIIVALTFDEKVICIYIYVDNPLQKHSHCQI